MYNTSQKFGNSKVFNCSALCSLFLFFSQISLRFLLQQISTVLKQHIFWKKRTFCLPLPAVYIPETDKYSCLHSNRWEKMPLVESTCCMNCHKLLQRIVVLETKLFAGLPKQTEHTADGHHGPPQHTAGESCESSESKQFIPSVEEQVETDRRTNRWHKQGARRKGSRDIRLSRVSLIAAVASSTPDTAMTRLASTGILQPPIHLENRFETLMNVDEESQNMTKLGSNQPAANIATNRRSRSSRRRHSAQSAAEPRTLIVGDSIIRNVSTRTTTTCCFPQATVSDVNKELRSIVMKHKTANRVIIHVGKNDIRIGQSELLKQDFSELFETLQRLEVQSFISGPLPARGTNMFSRLLGLNTWLQRTCSAKGVNFIDNFNIFWGHRQLFKLDGLHPNKLGARVLKDNFYFSLRHPSVVCANPLIHSPGQNMSDHRTSYQLPSHYVVEESHKDTDNATQPKQALLMDIPAEPCTQSSSHADCDVLQQLQDSAPKDDFLENSLGSQDNTSPETPELEPHSPDTLSLSPASPLLSFSQKMEELVYAGTKLSASPQISTKKRRAPQPQKTAGSALPPPPVRALRPLPQRKGPNPPPSAVGEPKTTDNSSQWYVSGPRYISSNIHKRLQNKREPSVPVAFSISVLSRDRRSKAFSSRTADPSNLRPVMHQSKIAVETKCNSIKLAFLNTRSLKNKSFVINDLITTNNLDFMFLIETWLEDNCSATVLTETAPPNFNFISVCRTVRRGGGVAALFKDVYQCKQVSFGQYLSFECLGIVLKGAPRILFIIIYRPPKYSPAFVEEFTELLSMISSEFDCFAIAGDFNIHIDNAEIKTTKEIVTVFKHFWPDSACARTHTQSWTHSRFTHQ